MSVNIQYFYCSANVIVSIPCLTKIAAGIRKLPKKVEVGLNVVVIRVGILNKVFIFN